MKHPRLYGAILVSLLLLICSVHAGSSADLLTQLKALEQNEPLDASSVSDDSGAVFYSAALLNDGSSELLPFPINLDQSPVWQLKDFSDIWKIDSWPKGEMTTNGLFCMMQPLLKGSYYVYVANPTTNDFFGFLHLPFEAISKIDLL